MVLIFEGWVLAFAFAGGVLAKWFMNLYVDDIT